MTTISSSIILHQNLLIIAEIPQKKEVCEKNTESIYLVQK
jgi:hypothetical protein